MKTKLIIMKCITDLHVGSGDETYSFIDNEVEKDCLTNLPVIHASGIKGAFREYFESTQNEKKEDIEKIFGAKSTPKDPITKPGNIKFLSAELLARPVRSSKGPEPYYMVTSNKIVEKMNEWLSLVGEKGINATCTLENNTLKNDVDIKVENIKLNNYYKFSICRVEKPKATQPKKHAKNNISFGNASKATKHSIKKEIFGCDLFVIDDESLGKISLPVIARNELINSKSNNLWYEEFVPHESIFMVPIICNDNDNEYMKAFTSKINGKVVQFGGNASVGYGLCKLFVLG